MNFINSLTVFIKKTWTFGNLKFLTFALLLFGIFIPILESGFIFIMSKIFDVISKGGVESVTLDIPFLNLMINDNQFLFISIGVAAAKILFGVISLILQSLFQQEIKTYLSQRVFQYYFRNNGHGIYDSAIITRDLTTEINVAVGSVVMPTIVIASEALILTGILLLLGLIQPNITIVIVSVGLLLGLVFRTVSVQRLTRWGTDRARHESLRLKFVSESYALERDLSVCHRKPEWANGFIASAGRCFEIERKQWLITQVPRLGIEVVLAIAAIFALVFVDKIEGDDVLLLLIAGFRALPSVARIIGAVSGIKYGLPAFQRISELCLTEPARSKASGGVRLGNLSSFDFDVQGYNLRFRSAEFLLPKTGLVLLDGPSGTGKTTLLRVLARLVNVTMVSGANPALRHDISVSYVDQFPGFFDGSLIANVVMTREALDGKEYARAYECLRQSGLLDGNLTPGMASVGESGAFLSGGQQRRLALARALYWESEVVILDEIFTGLDEKNSNLIENVIRDIASSSLVLIVTHTHKLRLKYDYIYEINDGWIRRREYFE